MIEFPSFPSPTPRKGPCVPELPDCPPNPLDVEPEVVPGALDDSPVVPDPLVPVEDDPNDEPEPLDEPNPESEPLDEPNPEFPDVPEEDMPGEAIPAALPSPELSIPPSGLPKNPFTVVFASPT
jgi:protein TonB